MQKSWYVHYMNKYPKAQIKASDDSLDVFTKNGEHLLAVRRDGAGGWHCKSEELGARDRHDLSPIPKEARLYKVVDGKIVKDDKYDERAKLAHKFACPVLKDKVLSCDELKKLGWAFAENQAFMSEPAKSEPAKKV